MNNGQETLKCQVYRLCRKLKRMRPPIDLNTEKADETLRFWLPEISWGDIEQYKMEFISDPNSDILSPDITKEIVE